MENNLKTLIYFLAVYSFCSCIEGYPDGTSEPGEASFAKNVELLEWQANFKPKLFSIIKLAPSLWEEAKTKNFIRSSSIFIPFDSWENSTGWGRDLHFLLKIFKRKTPGEQINCSFSEEGADLSPEQIYIEEAVEVDELNNFNRSVYHLYSCKNPNAPVTLHIMYTITGSAFLLIPHESTILNADKKAPSLIYYHGHGTRRTKSAFDVNNYTRGIGFKAALAGFIVLVPTVRSMEVWDDHASYTRELHKEGKSILAQAALDTAHLQTMLELDSMQKSYNYKIDPGANAVAGVSFGGQVAHLAGALDDRFEIVSTHGTYYGFEVINSDAHHRCQHLHDIEGVANIFDISMLIPPRILHVGIGDNDKFYNDFSVTAINRLTTNYKTAGLTICKGDQHDHGKGLDVGVDLPLYTSTNDKCELILDVVDDAGHEFVSEELFFQKLYHKITQN